MKAVLFELACNRGSAVGEETRAHAKRLRAKTQIDGRRLDLIRQDRGARSDPPARNHLLDRLRGQYALWDIVVWRHFERTVYDATEDSLGTARSWVRDGRASRLSTRFHHISAPVANRNGGASPSRTHRAFTGQSPKFPKCR